MLNSNSMSSASVKSAKNSSVVSSGKSAASAASNLSAAKASTKVVPRKVLPLDKRTSVKEVRDGVELLDITEKNGDKCEVYLIKPSYKVAEEIDDSRQVMQIADGQTFMRLTTPAFQEKIFNIMRNASVNEKPTKMGWKFADKHVEAFNWFINKANSFLTAKFNPAE